MTAPLRSRARLARGPVLVACLVSAALLAARLFDAPPLSDPAGAALPAGLRLHYPPLYLALAPLFTLWDGVSMLSQSRLTGFLRGLLLLWVVWRVAALPGHRGRAPLRAVGREAGLAILGLATLAAFVAGGALWHRPMASLRSVPPGLAVVDFHSHTNASHDVRGTVMRRHDAESTRRWHARAGFDAAFLTDHNTTAALTPAALTAERRPVLCPGLEVSAWRAHIVLLGAVPTSLPPAERGFDAVLSLIRTEAAREGVAVIASLPEYARHHWERLDSLAASGLHGFELVNAAPKANELSRARRDTVLEVAGRNGVATVGVSDSHGWGATSMTWSLVVVPAAVAPAELCSAIVSRIREGGSAAVRIVERHRVRPDDWWPAWLTPIGVVWEAWRAMPWSLTLSWLAWVWLLAAARALAPLSGGPGAAMILPGPQSPTPGVS